MQHKHIASAAPLDLSRWRNLPVILMVVGAVLSAIGAIWFTREFAYSWLLAFMFFLSICLGALFLVLAHHLFDAGWSVPIRRFCEHIACLLPWMAIPFVVIALFAHSRIYAWMNANPATDHALAAKQPLFTMSGFYIVSVFCFVVWGFLTYGLRYWSLEQDKTGAALPTYRM